LIFKFQAFAAAGELAFHAVSGALSKYFSMHVPLHFMY
jgi:hypothetical protein